MERHRPTPAPVCPILDGVGFACVVAAALVTLDLSCASHAERILLERTEMSIPLFYALLAILGTNVVLTLVKLAGRPEQPMTPQDAPMLSLSPRQRSMLGLSPLKPRSPLKQANTSRWLLSDVSTVEPRQRREKTRSPSCTVLCMLAAAL